MARTLFVLTGPVGGGKSTTALALAKRLRGCGQSAAVIDLDLVYCMARQSDGYAEQEVWARARRGAAALSDRFFCEGIQVVIVEGEFFCQAELDALWGALATPAELRFVTLDVSYEQALARVSGDPTRGLSRDPAFLRRLHDSYLAALPFLREVGPVIAADLGSLEQLAESILAQR